MATVLNDMGGSSKLIEDCKWNYEEGIVKQDVPNINNIERVGKVFYTCSYLCPKCRNFMLKANAGE